MEELIPTGPATSAPVARRRKLAGLDRRIGELTREERAAVRRGDWSAASACAVERAKLREARHRAAVRRWE